MSSYGFDTGLNDDMAEAATPPHAHILIVDDIDTIGFLLEETLKPFYTVTTASSGFDAIKLLDTQAFDLVLTDIRMPDIDGLQILRHIRSHSTRIPVIVLSAVAESEGIALALEAGADDYLTKPMERRELLARIRKQIDRKRQTDAHERTIAEFNRIKAMRDQFFRMASHDLKNPMNQIRLAQYLLRDTINNDSRSDELLDTIENAVDAMESIIGEFLEASTLHGQSLGLKLEKVNVEEVLWDCLIRHSASAQKKHVILRFEGAQGAICGDSQGLTHAVGNLINRAIRYSPAGSTITLSAENSAAGIRINIRDSAPGISTPEYTASLAGSRASTVSSETREGLGLWTARQFVEMQHGRIGADRLEEGGSVFWLEMPKWVGEAVPEPQREAS